MGSYLNVPWQIDRVLLPVIFSIAKNILEIGATMGIAHLLKQIRIVDQDYKHKSGAVLMGPSKNAQVTTQLKPFHAAYRIVPNVLEDGAMSNIVMLFNPESRVDQGDNFKEEFARMEQMTNVDHRTWNVASFVLS